MKINEIAVKEATLAKYDCVGDSRVGFENGKKKTFEVLTFTTVKTINCVVDYGSNEVIDIETGETFKMPVRNDDGRIVSFDKEQELHPIVIMDKNWAKISYLYQLSLKAQAKKVYNRYLLSKEEQKVKKIGSKNKEN